MNTSRSLLGASRSIAGPTLALLFALTAGLPAGAQDLNGGGRLDLADLAPADSFAFLRFAGLDECSDSAEGLGLLQLWKEPSVQRFLGRIKALYGRAAAGVPESQLKHWQAVKQALGGEIAVAAGGLTVLWDRSMPIPLPGFVVALDVGSDRRPFEQLLGRILREAEHELPGFTEEQTRIAGHDVRTVSYGRRTRVSLHAAFVGNLFLAGYHEGYFRRCLENVSGDARGATLASSASLRRARGKAAGRRLVEAWVNTAELFSRVRGLVPDPWLKALHDLGVDGIGSVYYASAVHEGTSQDTLFIEAPAPRRGLLKRLADRPVRAETLAMVPTDAVYVAALRHDLGGMVRDLIGVFERTAPGRSVEGMRRQLRRMEQEMGMSLEDLLGGIGDECLVYAQLSRTSNVPRVAGSVTLPDAEAAARWLDGFLRGLGMEVREVPFGGNVLHLVTVDTGFVPLSPSYAAVGRHLVFSLTSRGLKGALHRLEQPSAKSLADTERFKAVMDPLGGRRAAWIQYVDTRRVAAIGLDVAAEWLPAFLRGRGSVPVDFALMPMTDTIVGHLHDWGEAMTADQDGVVARSRGISLASALALAARFLDRAPGVPPAAIERILSGRVGAGDDGPATAPAGPDHGDEEEAAAAPQGNNRIVNPVAKGTPEEVELMARLSELDAVLMRDPDSTSLRWQRGLARIRLRMFEEAAQDFEFCYKAGFNKSVAAYNLCCAHSLLGRKDAAIRWLQKAVEGGWRGVEFLKNDSDLDNIRSDPRFQRILRSLEG